MAKGFSLPSCSLSGLAGRDFQELHLLSLLTSFTGSLETPANCCYFVNITFIWQKKNVMDHCFSASSSSPPQDLIRAAIGAALYIITSLICVIRGAGDGALIAGGVSPNSRHFFCFTVVLPLGYCSALPFCGYQWKVDSSTFTHDFQGHTHKINSVSPLHSSFSTSLVAVPDVPIPSRLFKLSS